MQNEIVERFDSERESIEGAQVPIPLCFYKAIRFKNGIITYGYDIRSLHFYFSCQTSKYKQYCC